MGPGEDSGAFHARSGGRRTADRLLPGRHRQANRVAKAVVGLTHGAHETDRARSPPARRCRPAYAAATADCWFSEKSGFGRWSREGKIFPDVIAAPDFHVGCG